MRDRYLAASPYNLVRIILGEPRERDSTADNIYTRAAQYFDDWMRQGILKQDLKQGFYAYFQDFQSSPLERHQSYECSTG